MDNNKQEHLLFDFDGMTKKDGVIRDIQKEFRRLGTPVASVDIPNQIKRSAGISYREVHMTFEDSQQVTFRVKKPGDIFEVKLNGKTVAIRNQDNQKASLEEISKSLDKGRTAFQRKLATQKVNLPRVGTSSKRTEQVQAEQLSAIQEQIADRRKALEDLGTKNDALRAQIADVQTQIDAANAS